MEPSCYRCGKKYYENLLEIKEEKVSCLSCKGRKFIVEKNTLKWVYYRFRAEFGLTLLGNIESIFICKLKF